MPSTPYPISGTIKNVDGSTALSGVTVTLYNETLSEEIKTNSIATTASDGTYTVDAANTTSAYLNGDTVVIEARKGYKIAQTRHTIDTSVGSATADMTLQYTDPLGMISSILSDNWQKGRTDNITPSFIITKDGASDINFQNNDIVRVYALKTTFKANALGGSSGYIAHPITIEVVCGTPKTNASNLTGHDLVSANDHAGKMKEEVIRVFTGKISNPLVSSSIKYDILDPYGEWIDLSDKGRNMGKWAIDMKLEELNRVW